MNFLKSIDDDRHHLPDHPELERNEKLVKLKRKGLIDWQLVYLKDGSQGIAFYWITDKGRKYVEERRKKLWLNPWTIAIVGGIIAAVIADIVLHFLNLK